MTNHDEMTVHAVQHCTTEDPALKAALAGPSSAWIAAALAQAARGSLLLVALDAAALASALSRAATAELDRDIKQRLIEAPP